MPEDSEDVLKKLREVRRKLQESLSDDSSKGSGTSKPKDDLNKSILIEGQAEIEKKDHAKQVEAKAAALSKKPKLYKAGEAPKQQAPKKIHKGKAPTEVGLSAKKMAGIQKRIRTKVASRQSMSKKRRAMIVISMVLAAIPLFMVNTLAMASCEFNLDGIGFSYVPDLIEDENDPSVISLTLPVTNPSILPATLGRIGLELWSNGETPLKIGSVSTAEARTIYPHQKTTMSLQLELDKKEAGKWITELFHTFMLNISVKNFRYNDIIIPYSIPIPAIDLFSMIVDLVGGLGLDSLITDLIGNPNTPSDVTTDLNQQIYNKVGYNPETGVRDFWKIAKNKDTFKVYTTPTSSQSLGDDMFLDIEESNEALTVNLSTSFEIDPIDGFDLGKIRIFGLDAGLYVDNTHDLSHYYDEFGVGYESKYFTDNFLDDYNYPVIKLDTYPSEKVFGGKPNGDIHINFGGTGISSSEANVVVKINKDNTGGAPHPSSTLDWDNKAVVDEFLNDAPIENPTFNLLYRLLKNGSMNCVLAVDAISIEIFGIRVDNIAIPRELLGVININDALDIQSLIDGMLASKSGGGVFGGLGMLIDIVGTGGLALGEYMGDYAKNVPDSSSVVDINAFEDMIDLDAMSDFDIDALSESWGPDANLSLTLPIGIKNFLIDLNLGLRGASIGLASVIDGVEKDFATATITSNGSDLFYIDGLGANATMDITLVIYKNSTLAPYAAKFLRTLLEDATLDAIINLRVDEIILFKENMTIPDFALGIPLELDLGYETIADLLGGLLDGMLSAESLFGELNESTGEPLDTTFELSGNPFTAAYEVPLNLMFRNPIMNFLLSDDGADWVESGNNEIDNSILPESSQDIAFDVIRYIDRTSIDVLIQDMDMAGLIPLTVGVGYGELAIYAYNEFNDWEKIVALKMNNFFEISATSDSEDISISLEIYDTPALCDFIHTFLDTGMISIKLAGSLTLNLSGIYLPNIYLEMPLENIDTGFNLSETIFYAVRSLDANEIIGVDKAAEEPEWWDGDLSRIPFVSQDFDIGSIFEIGDFAINSLDETDWPHKDKGTVTIDVSLPLVNYLMDLEIKDIEAEIYYDIEDPDTRLIRIESEGVDLDSGIPKDLNLKVTLYKSQLLEDWINNILATFGLSGHVIANVTLEVFNCEIGPIRLDGDNALDLFAIMPDISSLLVSAVPFQDETRTNGPVASQDIMDVIGQFALLYIAMPPGSWSLDCGLQNWDTPMLDVRVGVGLQPEFNMSIAGGALQLLDSKIYNAIYNPELGNKQEASHYSLMADASFEPGQIYFNNTYSCPDDPTNYNIDPGKPYYSNTTDELLYQAPDPMGDYLPYNMSTFAMFELSLKIFNISYGTYETRYPRHLWRTLGGPYFPVQTYGVEYGGYPEYRREYHQYFSPAYNILSGMLSDFDMENIDIGGMLSAIKLNGSITINIFSMDIVLDIGTDVVSSLMDTLLEGFALGMSEFIKVAGTPDGVNQPGNDAFINKETNTVTYTRTNEPNLPTAAAGTAFDISSFMIDYPVVGVWERNDHLFAPQYLGDGSSTKLPAGSTTGWGGSNIDPKSDGYVAGVYDPNVDYVGLGIPEPSNHENFPKDIFYDDFKLSTENYRKSLGLDYNPYFEIYDENGDYIEDPSQWALKWRGSLGRTRSTTLVYVHAIGPKIPIGILSGYFALWIDDVAKPCTIGPFGYAFINESVFIPAVPQDTQPGEWDGWRQDYYMSPNGVPRDDHFWIAINFRLFEGTLSHSFVSELLSGFNIRFVGFGTINASLFGYDIYGVSFGNLGLGDPSAFGESCADYNAAMGGGGSVWDTPTTNGTIIPTELDEGEWPPAEFYPEYADVEMTFADFDNILSSLTDDILGLLGDMSLKAISLSGIELTTGQISVDQVLPLPAWIKNLQLMIVKALEDKPDPLEIVNWRPYGFVESVQMLELESYPGQGEPLNFNVNNLDHVSLDDKWTFQPIDIYLDFGLLGGVNLGTLALALIGLADMQDAFDMNYMWIKIDNLIINAAFPWEFNYMLPFELGDLAEDLCFDIVDLVGGIGSLI